MSATVHLLHPNIQAIAGFIRVGHTGQRRLEALHAGGRLRFRRFVFDAAHIDEQTDLVSALQASGCEIVIDPNFAEMAAPGRYGSALAKLPWANPSGLWTADDFSRRRNSDPARLIAEFAVRHGASAVLAPTHLVDGMSDSWRVIDRQLTESLRLELDRLGGSRIAIDYQIITTSKELRSATARQGMIASVADLPVENLWLRISGFGATATGAGTRAFIEGVSQLHAIGLPIVADATGGFPALGAAAFGAVAGMSHGVCQKETFDASQWKRPPQSGGGGAATRIYVPELDRYLNEAQFNAVMAAKGGKSRIVCRDTGCCANGFEDQIEHADSHMLMQRSRQLDDLSAVPELRRAEHFLLRHVDPAVKTARECDRLKIADEAVAKTVSEAKERLIRLRDALGDLVNQNVIPSRSKSLTFRGGSSSLAAVLGR